MTDNHISQGSNCVIGDFNKFGKNVSIGDNVIVGNFVEIGDNVQIQDNVKITSFVQIKNNVTIDEGCEIKEFTRIDSFCKIGKDVHIRGHSVICANMSIEGKNDLGHALYCVNHVRLARYTNEEDVIIAPQIGYGARTGANVTLMPGIKLGKNCIVGAGSLVRKDVDPKIVVVGNPAEFLREIKSEEIIN